ncbi:MAG: tandem-95 repeat protein [Candidatus Accumulibacter sp.]|nr:tandem-95 repeat protein [Candidatus Accumulibacter propinquus]
MVNADGSFTYTPDADYHGPDSFTYTLTDADGDVSTATALLTVNPIDDLPVAVDDTFLTDEDSALTGQTLAPTTPPGDGGNTWALATGPSHGSVVVNADGSFTYTPDADYHGPDSFTYTLTDADGDVSTATALLTVNPIDDLPVAVDDTFLTDEDSALTQTLAPNDTPGGWRQHLGARHRTQPRQRRGQRRRQLHLHPGRRLPRPRQLHLHPDRCRWRCLHRHRPPDRQPHRRPAGRRRRHLPHRRRQRADRTDPGPQRHPSGDGGNTWALASGPSHGSVAVNADGSFTYTPSANYHGPDSFTYT